MLKLSEFASKEFQILYEEIKRHTLIDYRRCFMLHQFVKYANNLEHGEMVEVGVYKGGSAKLISKSTNKQVHLFDTFDGMPETDSEKDHTHKKGDFTIELNKTLRVLSDCNNINIYKGLFPATTIRLKCDMLFSFVHIDVDIYQSVKDCCEFFYPRMVKGGIIIFDDYGFPSCSGAKIAVDEFFLDKIKPFIYLSTGQGLAIKTE